MFSALYKLRTERYLEEMLEVFFQGLLNYAQPMALGFLVLGTCIGIFMGLLPAIGGLAAMALLLPMVYGIDRVAALSLLLAITAISTSGGSITAILMNIPGTATSAATMIDGFPMTQRGEAGRALGAMLASSGMGAILGVILAMGMVPLVIPLVRHLASPEIFFVVFMGISFLVVLSGTSKIKGLIAGLFGIFLALIGFQHATGIDRFSFGNVFLMEGLGFIPVLLGLFAGAELLELAIGGKSIVPVELARAGKTLRRQIFQGMREVSSHFWVWLRGCIVGYIIGAVPGAGKESAVWVAYGQAKEFSRHPEEFGTGCVDGVIAAESCSNASEGGSLLTTVALGIPGSSAMAILLGALMMQGIVPGIQMLTTELELSFTLFWGLALANIIGATICYFIIAYFNLTKITTLAPVYLVPPILTLLFVGSFAINEYMEDALVALVFTFIGFLMKRYGYSRPAMLLGFILGGYFEQRFYLSLQTFGPLFFLRPGALVIIAITIALYSFQPIRSFLHRRRHKARALQYSAHEASPLQSSADKVSPSEMPQRVSSRVTGDACILIVVILLMAAAIAIASGYPYFQGKMAPLLTGGVVFSLAVVQLIGELRIGWKSAGPKEGTLAEMRLRDFLREVAWLVGYCLGIYLFGFFIGIPAFIIAYMKAHDTKWSTAIAVAAGMTLFSYLIFSYFLDVQLYPGVILWQLGVR